MKLLFGQNLSNRLPSRLSDLFPNSTHVRVEHLERASDREIWEYAKLHGYAIVTQDADFAERIRLSGSPPKVIWLRCGNSTRFEVEALMRGHADLVIELIQNPGLHFVELF